MNFTIEELRPEDAEERLQYTKSVGSESDNLSFGPEGFPVSVEEERETIKSALDSHHSLRFAAKKDGKIIGDCGITGLPRRFSHRGELGLTVLREYWNMGVGSALLRQTLAVAKNELGLEVVSLEVRSDNSAAIHLYQKFGFRYMGTYEKYFGPRDRSARQRRAAQTWVKAACFPFGARKDGSL